MSILVVGNAVVDRLYRVPRLPAPGETLLATAADRQFGGKGLNQAVVAARAGARVRLLAAVGDDAEADAIAAHAAREPLRLQLSRQSGPSDESLILVAGDGENAIVSTAERTRSLPLASVDAALAATSPGDILLLQGNLSAGTTLHLLQEGGRRGLLRMANAAPVAFAWGELLDEVDVLVVNAVEARQLAPLRAAAVVVTDGAAGATLVDGSGRRHVPAPAARAIDTTAAGDVLCGVLAAALDRGLAMMDGLALAVRAAALKVSRSGTSAGLPSADELRELFA